LRPKTVGRVGLEGMKLTYWTTAGVRFTKY